MTDSRKADNGAFFICGVSKNTVRLERCSLSSELRGKGLAQHLYFYAFRTPNDKIINNLNFQIILLLTLFMTVFRDATFSCVLLCSAPFCLSLFALNVKPGKPYVIQSIQTLRFAAKKNLWTNLGILNDSPNIILFTLFSTLPLWENTNEELLTYKNFTKNSGNIWFIDL